MQQTANRHFLNHLLIAASIGLFVTSSVGLFSGLTLFAERLSHFKVQYVGCVALLAVFAAVNKAWQQGLKPLQASYPYSIFESQEDNFGIALLSKHPIAFQQIIYSKDLSLPSILSHIDINGKRIAIIGTHPLPPISSNAAPCSMGCTQKRCKAK